MADDWCSHFKLSDDVHTAGRGLIITLSKADDALAPDKLALALFFYLNVFMTLKTSRDIVQGEHSQEQQEATIHCMNGF